MEHKTIPYLCRLQDLLISGKPDSRKNLKANLKMEVAGMRKIVISNHKGGSGKTSIALNLAFELSREGRKVLFLDIDPQADATARLGILTYDSEKGEKIPTLYENLVRKWAPEKTIVHARKNLDIIPGDLDLEGCEVGELSNIPNRESLLSRRVVSKVKGYDYIIIDTPPSLGFMQLNALVACDSVYVALQTEYSAFRGIQKLFSKVEEIRDEINPSLSIKGILCTMFARTKHHRAVIDLVKEKYPFLLFETVIPRTICIANAGLQGKPVSEMYPDSKATIAYGKLATEFLAREEEEIECLMK